MSGGIRVAAIYANALAGRGHTVTVVSPAPPAPSAAERLRALFSRKQRSPTTAHPESHLDGLPVRHRILECWRPVEDKDVDDGDLVIATWWETAEWVNALDVGKGAKVYFVQHHEVFPYLPVERCHATYRLPMHKIVVAQWLRDTMHQLYGDRDVDLVPNAADRRQFHAAPRGKQALPTVGFLYTSTPFKGFDVLLTALNALRALQPEVRFVAFGSEAPSSRLPLPPGTTFTFRPPQGSLKDLYSRCDVWLTASRTEGFNLPALEAMACRTPVISTRTGWPAESIVSWRNGVLVEIDDAHGMAQAATQLLSLGDGEWQRLSEHAWQTASSLSWDRSVDMFEHALLRARARAARGEISGRPGEAPEASPEALHAR